MTDFIAVSLFPPIDSERIAAIATNCTMKQSSECQSEIQTSDTVPDGVYINLQTQLPVKSGE